MNYRQTARMAVMTAALLAASHAAAQPAPACKDTGATNVTTVSFDPPNTKIMTGLAAGLWLGLEPASFPASDIADAKQPCRRFTFDAGPARYTVYGDDSDSPPRWAISPNNGQIAYIAVIPDPLEAADWLEKRKADPQLPASFGSALYALVITDGERRLVYQFSRGLPDNYHLALEMKAALEGRWSPVAIYDVTTQQTDLSNIAMAGTQSSGQGLGPEPQKLSTADGRLFVADGQGGARHQASGLPCPRTIGQFKLEAFRIFDRSEDGRDVACRYFGDKAWFTVFATKFADASLDDVFKAYLHDSQASAPVVAQLPEPGVVATRLPARSSFWQSTQGPYQGMWVSRRGDWYYKVRATYHRGTEADVAAYARQVLSSIDESQP